MKILVVEDERIIAHAIKEGLEQDGYAVDVAYDGEDGYSTASADEYDVIISDVMMPEMNGYEMVTKLRGDGNKTPVLMLTAKDQERDVIKGLDTGADDYLAKPFAFGVLLARVRALLRRPQQSVGELLQYGGIIMDPPKKQVTRDGKAIQLSAKEYAILEYFLRNQERILSKNNILTHVWDFDSDVLPNNVESFIKLLRNKIDRPFKKQLIQTVRGFGYKLSEKA